MAAIDLLAKTRALHLIDIENLCADPMARESDVRAVLDEYLRIAHWRRGDLVEIACNPVLAQRFGWDPPVECNLHTASGEDAADLALLAHAAPEFVARRVGRLVIGSGDHAFIPRVLAARDLGVGVLVVSRPARTSQGWWRHGFPVHPLVEATRSVA